MNRKKAKRILALLILSVLCSTVFSFPALAVSNDTTGSITITALEKKDKEVISGAVFRLYFLANSFISGDDISYTYKDSFRENGMNPGDLSDEYLPIHLAVYAEEKGISYTEKVTDTEGKAVFDNLAYGAYLVVPAGIEAGYLKPQAFIVSVPTRDEAENKWVYNIEASPKIEEEQEETDEKIYISVKKQWENTENPSDHITVSLIKDGTVNDRIVLNADNNWHYRWDNLDKKHAWSVIENDVPKGYSVSYSSTQLTVLITNTAETPDDPGPSDDPENPDKLIQTGQLNWPVPVLTITGLVFFSIGWAMLNLGKKDEETV